MEQEVVRSFFECTRQAGLRVWKLGALLEEALRAACGAGDESSHEQVPGGRLYDGIDAVERVEAVQLAYMAANEDFCKRERKAHELLRLDPDNRRRGIMIERFLDRKSWGQVQAEVGVSERRALRLVKECCMEIGASREAAGILSDARGGES